ncbi:MAG: hypothetical protein M1827_002416 [Pycnora praestabilis]|nr:MAG: hypothetical protein M1827_002416 [Pycnora praestabilis]
MSSATSSPSSLPSSSLHLAPPSPLATATSPPSSDEPPPTSALAGVPELSTYATSSVDEKVAALKLVADSVAQQRQTASRALIFHPLCLGVFGVVLAGVAQVLLVGGGPRSHVAIIGTTWAGLTMAFLLIVRWATSGYIDLAERISWTWLQDDESKTDEVIVTKFGDEIIGAAVLRIVLEGGKGRRKKMGRGVLRAWTVRLRFRGKGVGEGLLEESLKLIKGRGAEGLTFAEDHANSGRILPPLFNGVFDRKEKRAKDALEAVVEAQQGSGKKR